MRVINLRLQAREGHHMIVGLILVGSFIGAVSALTALIIGQSIWMALITYSAVGMLSLLAGAAVLALRAETEDQVEPAHPKALGPPQRG